MELVKYNAACLAIAEAKHVDEVKDIRDKSEAMRAYAKQAQNKQLEVDAAEIRLRAERKLGQLIQKQKETVGLNQGAKKGKTGSKGEPLLDDRPTLAEAGISKKLSANSQKLADLDDEEFETAVELLRENELSVNQVHQKIKRDQTEKKREGRREENRQKVSEIATTGKALDAGAKFATIVIDPPWDWGDENDHDQLGRARPDYATMTIEEIAELPISNIADVDCHLYLWITNRSLPKGFRLLEEWGFRYITMLTWVKPHFGMGNYFRGQTEHVIFGVKGSQPLKRKDVGTVFHAARGPVGHSSKPTELYELVETCSPGPYIELFSRHEREGWAFWGENG